MSDLENWLSEVEDLSGEVAYNADENTDEAEELARKHIPRLLTELRASLRREARLREAVSFSKTVRYLTDADVEESIAALEYDGTEEPQGGKDGG